LAETAPFASTFAEAVRNDGFGTAKSVATHVRPQYLTVSSTS
jgi:hypothetical protein